MNLRRLAVTSALAITSLAVATGTAYAQPAIDTDSAPAISEAAPENDEINWASRVEAGGVVTTVDAGLFRGSDDGESVVLEDAEGNEVLALPVTFNLNGVEFPYGVEYTDEGRTVKLIPNLAAPIGLAPGALEQNAASPAENSAAAEEFQQQLSLATAVGGLGGTIVGGIVGGIAGFAACGGGALTIACFATVPAGASIGGVIGTIVVGGPTLAIAGIDYLNTLNAAPGTTRFAN